MPKKVWALAALVATLAACSTNKTTAADGSGGGGDGDSGLGPTITVVVDVTGAVTVKGTSKALPATYSGTDYQSCAAYGKGETREGKEYFVLPRNLNDRIQGKQVMVGAEVEEYKGPGNYPVGQLVDEGSPAGLDFDGKIYFIGENATSTTTVDANGGGKGQFTNLAVQNLNDTQTSGKLSGSVTWTCAD